jgi:serine/threonine protein kinase
MYLKFTTANILFFPDLKLTKSEEVTLTYKVRINTQFGNYLLWEAILQADKYAQEQQLVYVKAVQSKYYSLQAHGILFENGCHAPKIIATTYRPGGWLLIYMEHLHNHVTLDKFTHTLDNGERVILGKEIIRVIKILHDSNIVHGDLREGNILVCRNSEKGCGFDVKLIDFEWSGVVGTACYSHFMNHIDIRWPEGAEDGKKVTMDHDNIMLEKTLQKTNLLIAQVQQTLTKQLKQDSNMLVDEQIQQTLTKQDSNMLVDDNDNE